MEEKDLKELRDPASWDAEQGETRPGERNARAVVSVDFSSQEFQEMTAYARKAGLTTSAFIRTAALERVRRSVEAETAGTGAATSRP